MNFSEHLLLRLGRGPPLPTPPAITEDSHTFSLSARSRWLALGTSHHGPRKVPAPWAWPVPPAHSWATGSPPPPTTTSALCAVSGSATPPPTIPEKGGGGDVIIRALGGGTSIHNGTKTSGPSRTLSDATVACAVNSVLSTLPANPDIPVPSPACQSLSGLPAPVSARPATSALTPPRR